MADESAPEAKGGGGGGGSVLKKWGPLAAIVLVAQVVLAWVVITKFMDKLGGGAPKKEDQALFDQKAKVETSPGGEKESHELPYYWQPEALKKMATNPAGTNATRFVAFDVELGVVDPAAKEGGAKGGGGHGGEGKPAEPAFVAAASNSMGKIAGIIVEVMRSKTVDQLDSEALPEVQEEIRRRLNQQVFERIFPKGAATEEPPAPEARVAEVIFTKFVIQ